MWIWAPAPLTKGKKNQHKSTPENQIFCRLGAKTLLKLIGISGRLGISCDSFNCFIFPPLIASRNVGLGKRENWSKQKLLCANEMLHLPSSKTFGEDFSFGSDLKWSQIFTDLQQIKGLILVLEGVRLCDWICAVRSSSKKAFFWGGLAICSLAGRYDRVLGEMAKWEIHEWSKEISF